MECYEGATMTVKTFRGLLADGATQEINLKTNTGKIGYRIVKFQIIPNQPGTESTEAVVKIYKVPQTAATATIEFNDNTLLAAGFFRSNASAAFATDVVVLFDNEIFNQDIYITSQDLENNPMNYYIELEQVKLNDNESTMATLQSIRSRYESYTPAGPT